MASSTSFAFNSLTGTDCGNAPPALIMEQLAAGAFLSLCEHLRVRSDQVQNIDLMAIGGFCRNCLAKWMVIEARKLSKRLRDDATFAIGFSISSEECQGIIKVLDGLGYDEAAQEVYGCTYPEWKKLHQKKASEEQMERYKNSVHLHTIHNEDVLKKVGTNGDGVSLNYCQNFLSQRTLVRLRAGTFLSLCHHLRERSDAVQNMDLMTISGFCRNCLAKWLVVEARQISDQIRLDVVASSYFIEEQQYAIKSLDSFGYDEAAQVVYGCTYPEWKKRHQKKATDEQMELYNGSAHIHAKHDKELLATRTPKDRDHISQNNNPEPISKTLNCAIGVNQNQSLLSDVCCQDIDNIPLPEPVRPQPMTSSFQKPRPPKGGINIAIAILTVSDRAASNSYKTGDLGGPAVEKAVLTQIDQLNASFSDQKINVTNFEKQIVPDEISAIKEVLLRWSGKPSCSNEESGSSKTYDLVFTTGGTGFATRDVTPEATLSVLDRECHGLMSWASLTLTSKQPLATLSRASAGICGKSLIINLPGNPAGASQVVDLLFPLLLHAAADLSSH